MINMRGRKTELTKEIEAFLDRNPVTVKKIREHFSDANPLKIYSIIDNNKSIASRGPRAHKVYFLKNQEAELESELGNSPKYTTKTAILEILDNPLYVEEIEERLDRELGREGLRNVLITLEREGELRRIRFVKHSAQTRRSHELLGNLYGRTLVYKIDHKSLAAERIIKELPTPNDETKHSITTFLTDIDSDVAEIVYNSYTSDPNNAKIGHLRKKELWVPLKPY